MENDNKPKKFPQRWLKNIKSFLGVKFMKNMKFSEFLNLMYEKQEIEFSYSGHHYNFELSSENLDKNKPF